MTVIMGVVFVADRSNYNSNYYWDASTEWTFGPGKP